MIYARLILSTFDNIPQLVKQIRTDKIKAGWKLIQPALKTYLKALLFRRLSSLSLFNECGYIIHHWSTDEDRCISTEADTEDQCY